MCRRFALVQPVNAVIPEIPIAKRKDQRGIAKIAVFAYHRQTGAPVWQSGLVHEESSANDVWILGAGPFQRGTIYQGTEFAGSCDSQRRVERQSSVRAGFRRSTWPTRTRSSRRSNSPSKRRRSIRRLCRPSTKNRRRHAASGRCQQPPQRRPLPAAAATPKPPQHVPQTASQPPAPPAPQPDFRRASIRRSRKRPRRPICSRRRRAAAPAAIQFASVGAREPSGTWSAIRRPGPPRLGGPTVRLNSRRESLIEMNSARNRELAPALLDCTRQHVRKLRISREIRAILTFAGYFNCVDRRDAARPLLLMRASRNARPHASGMTRLATRCSKKDKGVYQIMLVLSRKVGERIHVGDNIVLEIRRIAGNRVTVALEAPRDVRILRGELEGPAREFRTPEPQGSRTGRGAGDAGAPCGASQSADGAS